MIRESLRLTCLVSVILLCAISVSANASQAKIKRDNYGVPHVYSETLQGLFFGYGYAVAQDRLYQIEMFRRTYWGRLSEVYGQGLLGFDQANRRDNLTLFEIKRQLRTLKPELQEVLKAFSSGINKYITEALTDKNNKLPKEFHYFGFDPEPWSPEDVAANFLSVMGFFMDVSAELLNASMLEYLTKHYGIEKAKKMFDDWCWGHDSEAPTTISPTNIRRSKEALENESRLKEEHWKHPLMEAALSASRRAQITLARERLGYHSLMACNFPYAHPTSYAAVISSKKSATGEAMLLGGPQFDFQIPSVCYEVGLHGAGIDCVWATIAGYPFIMFGHNRRAAFTSTAGIDNIEDIFAEKLNPAHSNQYWFNGEWKKMKVRVETFRVKGGKKEPVSEEFFHTVHGSVFYIDKTNNVAFSKKLSCRDTFLQGLASFYELMKAETVTEFNRAAQVSDMAVNYFFANTEGDIAYYHLGLYPVREEGVDVRLPTPGTGEFEWKGYLSKTQNPHAANPPHGYFVNQNEQPEPGWSHGDLATTDVWGGWGADNRVSILIELAEAKHKFDQQEFKNIVREICFYDLRAMNIKALLLEAVQGINSAHSDIEEAFQLVAQWSNQHIDQDADGFYDHPGSAIFDRWWKKAVAATFGDWFPGYQNSLGKGAVDILSNRYMGHTLFYRALKGETNIDYFKGRKAEIVCNALKLALKELGKENPGKTVTEYRKKTVMYNYSPVTVLGHFLNQQIVSSLALAKDLPSFLSSPGHSHNRGAVNHIVTLAPNKIIGENITSPGNSGFIKINGTKSPHFGDQVKMFVDFDYKPMLFMEAHVNAAVTSTQVVKWK